jgi:two-component system, sensor histidine kinase and response regulator
VQEPTILIADHETHVVNVLAARLRDTGYQVVTAGDGGEAYRLARSVRPDLIIADYQMPCLSGLELCSRLRHDPLLRDIPVIILAACGLMPPTDAETDQIRRIIGKPFRPQAVVHEVETLLEGQPAPALA